MPARIRETASFISAPPRLSAPNENTTTPERLGVALRRPPSVAPFPCDAGTRPAIMRTHLHDIPLSMARSTSSSQRKAPAGPRYHRIVAKLGTNVLTAGTDRLDTDVMASLVGQVARLRKAAAEVLVVTSGAIAAGRHRLGGSRERKEMPFRQMLAAVGQSDLMQAYQELFGRHGITVAQTLLTRRDLADRQGYLNARNTLLGLLQVGVVPVINENDVVAVDEIEGAKIGDNDNLSALVANLVDADLLVLLTDQPRLSTPPPPPHPHPPPLAGRAPPPGPGGGRALRAAAAAAAWPRSSRRRGWRSPAAPTSSSPTGASRTSSCDSCAGGRSAPSSPPALTAWRAASAGWWRGSRSRGASPSTRGPARRCASREGASCPPACTT